MGPLDRLAVFICSFGYVGFFPFAPGTIGSAVGLAVYLTCRYFGMLNLELPVIVVLLVLGVWLTAPAEKALGCVDPGPIVIDEVMGMLITLFLIPVGWAGLLLSFCVSTLICLSRFKPFFNAAEFGHVPTIPAAVRKSAAPAPTIYPWLVARKMRSPRDSEPALLFNEFAFFRNNGLGLSCRQRWPRRSLDRGGRRPATTDLLI